MSQPVGDDASEAQIQNGIDADEAQNFDAGAWGGDYAEGCKSDDSETEYALGRDGLWNVINAWLATKSPDLTVQDLLDERKHSSQQQREPPRQHKPLRQAHFW